MEQARPYIGEKAIKNKVELSGTSSGKYTCNFESGNLQIWLRGDGFNACIIIPCGYDIMAIMVSKIDKGLPIEVTGKLVTNSTYGVLILASYVRLGDMEWEIE